MYCVGWGMYKLVINKVVDKDLFTSILATFGISILAQQLMNFAFGADVVVAQSNFGTTMLFNNRLHLPNAKIFSGAVCVISAIILVIYMKKIKIRQSY